MPHSDALDARIRDEAARLEKFFPRLTSCRIVVAAPHHHQHRGELFAVHLDIGYPGGEAVVGHHQHEDVYVALRDAFLAARRELEKSQEHLKGAGRGRNTIRMQEPANEQGAAGKTAADHE
jgi:ribosomal subunit interface protein